MSHRAAASTIKLTPVCRKLPRRSWESDCLIDQDHNSRDGLPTFAVFVHMIRYTFTLHEIAQKNCIIKMREGKFLLTSSSWQSYRQFDLSHQWFQGNGCGSLAHAHNAACIYLITSSSRLLRGETGETSAIVALKVWHCCRHVHRYCTSACWTLLMTGDTTTGSALQ